MVSKRQGIIAVIVVIVLVAAGLVVMVGSNSKQPTNSGPQYVIDAMGRNVTTNITPTRIVSASPTITELVYALGAGQKLVAVTDYCDYPSDVVARKANGSLASIGGYSSPVFEKIVNQTPDLVFLDSAVAADKDLMPQLDAFHIRYIVLFEGTNTSEVYNNIGMAGKALHDGQAAQNLVSTMQDRFASIVASVGTHAVKPRVMVAIYMDSSSLWIAGGHTFIDDIVVAAGGINAFGNVTGFQGISREAAVQAHPDVILVATMSGLQVPQDVYDTVMNDTIMKSTEAVQNKSVYIISDQAENSFLHQGVREVQAAQILTDLLYPSTFNASIPHFLGDEYLQYLPASWAANATAAQMPVQTNVG